MNQFIPSPLHDIAGFLSFFAFFFKFQSIHSKYKQGSRSSRIFERIENGVSIFELSHNQGQSPAAILPSAN